MKDRLEELGDIATYIEAFAGTGEPLSENHLARFMVLVVDELRYLRSQVEPVK